MLIVGISSVLLSKTVGIIRMNLMQGKRQGLEGKAYHAGVLLPDFVASLTYFSELNSYLYVGGKLIAPSTQPSNVHPFPSSFFSCQRRSVSWKF